jgi:hypothetical protein
MFFRKPELMKIYVEKALVSSTRAVALFIGLHYVVATYAMYEAGYMTSFMASEWYVADSPVGF